MERYLHEFLRDELSDLTPSELLNNPGYTKWRDNKGIVHFVTSSSAVWVTYKKRVNRILQFIPKWEQLLYSDIGKYLEGSLLEGFKS